jgi:diadenosine tetraphosphate (Ap4A) HIT family hydrolase
MANTEWKSWPPDWDARKAGDGCQLCGFLRTEDPTWGLRVYTGQVANAYLWARGQITGYCVVIWRAGHICEPTDLAPADAGRYFTDMLTVGQAVTTLLGPTKLNYETLGNAVPHLHTHVVPRGHDDPNPGGPLPWTYLDDGHQPPGPLRALADDLRRLLPTSTG